MLAYASFRDNRTIVGLDVQLGSGGQERIKDAHAHDQLILSLRLCLRQHFQRQTLQVPDIFHDMQRQTPVFWFQNIFQFVEDEDSRLKI